MKRILCVYLFCIAFAGHSFAADRKSVEITFPTSITVGSTELRPGNYFVRWTHSAQAAQVDFILGNKTIVSENAQVVLADNVAATREVPNGVEVTTSIENNKTILLELSLPHFNLLFAKNAH